MPRPWSPEAKPLVRGSGGLCAPEAGDILKLEVHIREGFCNLFSESLHNRLVSYNVIYNYTIISYCQH